MANPGNQDPFGYQQQPQAPGEETHLGTPLVQPGQPQGAPPSFAQPPGAPQAGPEVPQPPAAAPQPPPGTAPPFAYPPGTPQPFAYPPGAPQPFAQAPGTPPPFAPPYGAPFAGPGTPQPFGQGGFPAPPHPPAKSRTGLLIALGAIVAVVVVLGAGAVALTVLDGEDPAPKVPEVTMPSVSVPPIPTVSVPPVDVPTLPADSTPKQVPDILKASVKTAFGTTYTRAGTSSGKCPSIAPKALRKVLEKNPCIGRYKGAVYSSPKKDAVVTVVIMPLKNADAAAALKRAGKLPYLIAPKKGSGVKSFGTSPVQTWYQVHIEGNLALFTMAYRSDMGKTDKGGIADKASAELGTELSNVLKFQ
ncbi:hypothetical protein EDD29_8852 [Actinocorallia herbida]|uniref:Uncharacterized protein n=1 Tax=Actinocorallia herbida TaxID=58109 RepID=A0A3N1DC49_9ACTN|nr:hypothetical protein [Actinocorallia herbida]ROO91105.1 hypothetical protein EDD29_8852 [Actinocorallia herbida]